VERVYLDIIAQSQSNDEFWYFCVPNDETSNLESCGNTAFRETEVVIDGQPAGVAPVYPWIYTGGIDVSGAEVGVVNGLATASVVVSKVGTVTTE